MSNLTGVLAPDALKTLLTLGPAITSPLTSASGGWDSRLWPQIDPGWFRSGASTVIDGHDYLFAREGRVTFGPFINEAVCSTIIPRRHGPTIALWTGTTASVTAFAASGQPSLDLSWKALVYGACRYRFLHQCSGWVSAASGLYKLVIPDEIDGVGYLCPPLPRKLRDSQTYWDFLGSPEDLVTYGIPGARQWAKDSSGQVFVLPSSGQTPSSGMCVSWIAGQTTLDWEEMALTDSSGNVSLGCPTRLGVGGLTLQYVTSSSATGGIIADPTSLPLKASITGGLRPRVAVVVRYKPQGIYALSPSGDGAVVAARLPSSGQVMVRFEESTPAEPFAAGRPAGGPLALYPPSTPPGFIYAVTPGTPTPQSQPKAASYLDLWAHPQKLFPTRGPWSLARVVVRGADNLPSANITVSVSGDAALSLSATTLVTGEDGQAFFRVKYNGATGSASGTATITAFHGALTKTITLTLAAYPSNAEWVRRLRSGQVSIAEIPGVRPRSGSSRKSIALWRVQEDGQPSPFSDMPLTISCKKGKLFVDPLTLADAQPAGGGGKSITLTPRKSSNPDWFDGPLLIEYESTGLGEKDVIYARWEGDDIPLPAGGTYALPKAFGRLEI